MDWFRQIQVHFFTGYSRAAVLVVITSIITTQIHALDSYEFRLGTNAVIPFSYTLCERYEHFWEIFRVGVSRPFNINGTMNLDALSPSQSDRFNIRTTWGEDVLQVDLHIRDISKIDRGVYVWAVSHDAIRAKRLAVSFDVFVDVILPPGRAKCDIRQSPYSLGLREVHCQATVGSDGGGLLICYQNDVKTPFQSPPARSATDVTAVFWMDEQYDINCCSHEANYEKIPDNCNDFTEGALIESPIQTPMITSKPLSTNLKNNGKPMSPSSPLESEHPTDSANSTEETTYFSRDQSVCKEYKHLHYGYVLTICILCIALVISVCINGILIRDKMTKPEETKGKEDSASHESTVDQNKKV